MYKNFGLSAGVTFSMLISDGKLKRIKQRETDAALSSISIYKNNLVTQNEIHRIQCSEAVDDYDTRIHILETQITEYGRLLDICQKEIRVGQMSVFDYITTLKNMISVRQQKLTVEANRQLAVNAYNYYNW
jgi:outer membrane protein TolC